MQDEVLFWQARVIITQAPVPFEPKEIPEDLAMPYQTPLEVRSFLYDPFGEIPLGSYGLELFSGDKLELTFFTQAESEKEAIELGNAWLLDLKYRFLGLDGYVVAKPIISDRMISFRHKGLTEIILPKGILKNKINIIERFVNAFYNNESDVQLYIIWKKEPKRRKHSFEPEPDTYFLRIFINYKLRTDDITERLKLRGLLRFIFMDIEDVHLKRAYIENPSDISISNILGCDVFDGESTLTFNKINVNFDFSDNLPLPKLPILENENVRYIDLNSEFKEKAIRLGLHIKKGVITNHEIFTPINKLPQDIAIFGKSGSGKTYLLAMLIQELCIKVKEVGILVLNVAKESQEIFYNNFNVIRFSDNDFHIPYFFNSEKTSLEKRLQETATYICASLGLKNVFEKIIYRTEIGFLRLEDKLPEYFYTLLKGVEKYMRKNPYGPEEQSNLMQAFRNRMNVFEESKLKNVLEVSEQLPKWVNDWLNGSKIFLDLSMCSKYVKLLIVNAIFQLIRTITKDCEAENLKHLIVIDEAHAILEKPITTNSDDADFIMKEQMAKIFSELLKEYRSRGVGFVIADQSPDRLFDDVASQPSIKVIFRQDYPNNLLFSEDPKERQMLTQLENRLALVVNGATGEKYLMKTLDYSINRMKNI